MLSVITLVYINHQLSISRITFGTFDITLWESCFLTVWFCLQWRMTVTQVSTAIRRPIWRARPVRRIITTVLLATPRASAWPEGPTAVNPASGRPACMPAPRRARSLFLVWRTSAATLGPVFHPMGVAPSPPCSQWSGCPTSTSPLTSPQGLWCPDLAGSAATPLHSWATATTLPCTRAQWPTRLWAASAVLGLGSSRRPLACRETSTSIHTAYHVHYRLTSTTLYIVLASCQSGTRTAKRAFSQSTDTNIKGKEEERTKTRQGLDESIFIFLEDMLLIILMWSVLVHWQQWIFLRLCWAGKQASYHLICRESICTYKKISRTWTYRSWTRIYTETAQVQRKWAQWKFRHWAEDDKYFRCFASCPQADRVLVCWCFLDVIVSDWICFHLSLTSTHVPKSRKKGRLSSVTISWVLIFFSVFVVNMKQQTGAFVVVNSLSLKSVGTVFISLTLGCIYMHAQNIILVLLWETQ